MSEGRWYYVAVGAMTAVAGLWAPQGHNAVGLAVVSGLCLGRACVLWMRDDGAGRESEHGQVRGAGDGGGAGSEPGRAARG